MILVVVVVIDFKIYCCRCTTQFSVAERARWVRVRGECVTIKPTSDVSVGVFFCVCVC